MENKSLLMQDLKADNKSLMVFFELLQSYPLKINSLESVHNGCKVSRGELNLFSQRLHFLI